MKNRITGLLLLASLLLGTSQAFAGATTWDFVTTGSGNNTDTKAFAGLKWSMEGGATPAFVLGVTRAKTKSNGDTTGGLLSVAINIKDSLSLGKVKLSLLKGQEDLQGELGGGFDYAKHGFFFSVGANGPHVNGGLDIGTDGEIDPFLMLHTLGEFKRGTGGTSCEEVPGGAYSDSNCRFPLGR